MGRKGEIATSTLVYYAVALIFFVIVFSFAVTSVPKLFADVLDQMRGISGEEYENYNPILQEAVDCVYYRCSKGCDFVETMNNNGDFDNLNQISSCECDMEWDDNGDGKICGDESESHPIKVDINEEYGIYAEDPIEMISKSNENCAIPSLTPLDNTIFIAPNSVIDESCNRDQRYRYYDVSSSCRIHKGTYYLWSDGDDKNPNVVICDEKSPEDCSVYQTETDCEENLCNWCGCYFVTPSTGRETGSGSYSITCIEDYTEEKCAELGDSFPGTTWLGCIAS